MALCQLPSAVPQLLSEAVLAEAGSPSSHSPQTLSRPTPNRYAGQRSGHRAWCCPLGKLFLTNIYSSHLHRSQVEVNRNHLLCQREKRIEEKRREEKREEKRREEKRREEKRREEKRREAKRKEEKEEDCLALSTATPTIPIKLELVFSLREQECFNFWLEEREKYLYST